MLKRAIEALRNLDLTGIGKSFISKTWGFIASFFGGFILKFLEKLFDRKLKDAEDALDVKEADKEIEVDRTKKAEAIKNAETDEQIDDAFRDSLR